MTRISARRTVLFFLLLPALAFPCAGCRQHNANSDSAREMPTKDINAVLRAHDAELMKIQGVVGVYIGLSGDQKTLCLKVMVNARTPELEGKIPESLEGYRIEIEETGPIRPMKGST